MSLFYFQLIETKDLDKEDKKNNKIDLRPVFTQERGDTLTVDAFHGTSALSTEFKKVIALDLLERANRTTTADYFGFKEAWEAIEKSFDDKTPFYEICSSFYKARWKFVKNLCSGRRTTPRVGLDPHLLREQTHHQPADDHPRQHGRSFPSP